MAALVPITPLIGGALSAGIAVGSTDTVDRAIMGPKGAYLEIINAGGSPDAMTISDASATPTGAAAAANAPTVTNGTSKVFHLKPEMVNPATGLITITNSFLTTVTYKLYPVG